MDIRGLGYIGVNVNDIGAWRSYAELLGTMVVPSEGGFKIRIDDRPFRVAVRQTDAMDGLLFAGWELPNAAALDQAVEELTAAGFNYRTAGADECAERHVRGMIRTTDPGAFELELFHGPVLDHEAFVSPTGLSGFVTGDMGLGHIVLKSSNLADSVDFYTKVLGFRVSDFWRVGDDDVVFAHCNARHHSLALIGAAESALHHIMFEARSLDDVGSTLDRLQTADRPISLGLGKHTNDQMVSFYSRTPSGFDVEFGCGGLQIDDTTWTVTEITKPSFWGHRPPTSA